MPRRTPELTQRGIVAMRREFQRSGQKAAAKAVGGCKYLYWCYEVRDSWTSEWWEFKYPHPFVPGKRQKMGLGSCSDVTLADARNIARSHLSHLNRGLDPVTEQHNKRLRVEAEAVKYQRFRDFAHKSLERKTATLEPKGAAQYFAKFEQYVYPIIGKSYVHLVDVNDIASVLLQKTTNAATGETGPFWVVTHEYASRLRASIEDVLKHWASMPPQTAGYLNPASKKNGLETMLPAVKKKVNHHRWLHWRRVPEMFAWLNTQDSDASECLQLLILQSCRFNEVGKMRWDELDLLLRQWQLPAERMKARKAFIQPLTTQALGIIVGRKRVSDHVWKEGGLSEAALRKLIKRSGYDTTIHGFRASFRTWAADNRQKREIAELNLAHTQPALEKAYQHSLLLEERLEVQQMWADFVTGEV